MRAIEARAEAPTRRLLEGSAAIAEAMVLAGCRFFAGYPMTPFTEILEHMAARLPEVGGVCMNAESELEAIGMTWGAAVTGTRAATGSTGQGLSLMQESIAEASLAGLPMVILDMARGQGDYFQATRGGGHGDYRTPVLAPMDPAEAVGVVQEAFELADRWRNPVIVMGDYYLAHTWQSVTLIPSDGPVAAKPWALDGSSGGTGSAKLVSPLGDQKRKDEKGFDLARHYVSRADACDTMLAGIEPRVEAGFVDGAEVVVVAYGTLGKFVRYVVSELRAEGHAVGYVRPITLLPFPTDVIARAAEGATTVAVYEQNRGQMIDDVRLSVLGRAPVVGIGGLSLDSSGFGIGPDIEVPIIRDRVLQLLEER